MQKFFLLDYSQDGYERFATIEDLNKSVFNVHFLELDEYLEYNKTSNKINKGDIIEGDLSIELVCESKKTNESIMHSQKIPNSSHIEAIIEVTEIVDECSVKAKSTVSNDIITVEFEKIVNYEVGNKVFVVGSLELNF